MIDLQRPRDVGELLTETFRTFGRRWHVFLAMTFVVVAPWIVLLDGVWGRVLADGPRADRPLGQELVSALLAATVIPATVTGLHCVVVAALGEDRLLGFAEAFGGLLPRLPLAVGAALVYIAGVALGLVALVVPGVWLSIRWFFAVQAAVLEERRPRAALARSAGLVDGTWWRVFGLWLVMALITGLIISPASSATFGESGVLWVLAQVLAQTLTLSLSAIYGTLMFFDLCARRAAGPAAEWVAREARQEWLPPRPPPVPGA